MLWLAVINAAECHCPSESGHLQCCQSPPRRWLLHDKLDTFRSTAQ